jgi:3-deoxy-manno-octulosonate cytidylyltransferase (CMP-KDO synthetase)
LDGFKVVIPARYGSSRFPGKPLAPVAGRPMIALVHARAAASGAEEVIVATDDERIAREVEAFGGRVCMTRDDHHSGTDRIAEVADAEGWTDETVIVNLQGDEPLMPPALVAQVARDMADHPEAGVTTLGVPVAQRAELFDPHVVKVVTDLAGYALYFSRAPVPWHRDEFLADDRPLPPEVPFQRHIGLYAYRAGFLRRFVEWSPCPLERAEALEQLRVLWHGGSIHVGAAAEHPGPGVDTPDDIKRVEALLAI